VANHRGDRRARRRTPEPETLAPGSHRGSQAKTRRHEIPALEDPKPVPTRHLATEVPAPRRASRPGARRADQPRARREPGARRASHAGARKKLVPALPSVPTLAGAAVVALAATGALTLGPSSLSQMSQGGFTRLSAQADLHGTDAFGSRSYRPSRDAQRAEIPDAEDPQLVAAADAQAQQRNATLDALAASAQRHADSLVWHLPVARGAYQLTARFGEVSGLWAHVHTGLDFAAPIGTPIMAVSGGVITSTGWAGAYGNRTIETLPDGTELWYCHQNGYNVQVGQHVSPGQVIGYVGATGNVTGPHVHLEVRPHGGDPVDPYTALLDHGVHP